MQSLFRAVLPGPGHGIYFAVGIKKANGPKKAIVLHRAANNFAELEQGALDFESRGLNTYFALSSFTNGDSRETDNAAYAKAVWFDIDTQETPSHKETAVYKDRTEAAVALRKFVTDTALPDPWIVDSGGGLHVYWPLEAEVTKEEWQPIARGMAALGAQHGLDIDNACTTDASRILRVPGTTHVTSRNIVRIIHQAVRPLNVIEVTTLKEKGLAVSKPDSKLGPRRQLDEATKALLNNKATKFSLIAKRSLQDEGCAHIKHIVSDQASVSEPMWRAGLSIAWYCDDAETSIHKMSKDHPNYDADETRQKAEKTKGPYVCKTFDTLAPGVCQGCPHYEKITSPIQLGVLIEKAAPGTTVAAFNSTGVAVQYQIPPLPWPYFRGKAGGIWKEKDGDSEKETCVYEHDFFVTQRLYEAGVGEMAWLRLYLPRDGLRQFTTPVGDLLSKDKCRDLLASNGVFAYGKQMDNIMTYITRVLKELQVSEKAMKAHAHFGWTENDESFVVGESEITPTAVIYTPPSVQTKNVTPMFEPKGSLTEWQDVFNLYARPGFEPHAFAACTAFGSPLFKFTGHRGSIINLLNNESGTGKSTILGMSNSVFGHPTDLMMLADDTQNARIHRMGVLSNIAGTLDEVTNMKSELISDTAYTVTHGRGKNRMQSQSNSERVNHTRWSMIMLSTSNASLYDKLLQLKAFPDGESMRIIEYQIDRVGNLDKAEADKLFSKLAENYGHAGIPYMQWVVANRDKANALRERIQQNLDKALGYTGRERFWSSTISSNLAGGHIARDLGLIEYDMERVYEWCLHEFSRMQKSMTIRGRDAISTLGEFINDHMANILIINENSTLRTGLPEAAIREPRSDLMIRIEPDTKRMYISARGMRDFCTRQQLTYKDVIKELGDAGIYMQNVKKRLSKGTHITATAVDALEIDMDKAGMDPIALDVPASLGDTEG
jgi:hypothetical protein